MNLRDRFAISSICFLIGVSAFYYRSQPIAEKPVDLGTQSAKWNLVGAPPSMFIGSVTTGCTMAKVTPDDEVTIYLDCVRNSSPPDHADPARAFAVILRAIALGKVIDPNPDHRVGDWTPYSDGKGILDVYCEGNGLKARKPSPCPPGKLCTGTYWEIEK